MRGRIPAVLALLLAAAAATFGLLGLPTAAYASEPGSPAATGSFDRMSSFTADYGLDAEGGATVTETIDYVFGTSTGVNHGILRNIVTQQAVRRERPRVRGRMPVLCPRRPGRHQPDRGADPDEGDRPVGRHDPDPRGRPRRHRQRLRDVRLEVPLGQRDEPVPRPRGVLLQRLRRRLGPEGPGQGDRDRAGRRDRGELRSRVRPRAALRPCRAGPERALHRGQPPRQRGPHHRDLAPARRFRGAQARHSRGRLGLRRGPGQGAHVAGPGRRDRRAARRRRGDGSPRRHPRS